MAIGMAPAKWEVAAGRPFVGSSGKMFDEALASAKQHRAAVFVTNLIDFYIDDNDIFSVPEDILEQQFKRVFAEIERVKPNILMILGGDTLCLLQEGYCGPKGSKQQKKMAAKWGITKWRGSLLELTLPSGRTQKCIAMMHPAAILRGLWKWHPIFKYIDVPRAVTQSLSPQLILKSREAILGTSFQTAKDGLREARSKEWVSIDYEGYEFLTCLGFGWSDTSAMCIPITAVGKPAFWTISQEAEIWELWCQLLEDIRVKKIAQNSPYEIVQSWKMGMHPRNIGFDTMHGHHCLYPDFGGVTDEWTGAKRNIGNPGHGLAFQVSQYCEGAPFYKDDGRHWRPELGQELFWQYNCKDVFYTYDIAMKQITELKELGLWDTYTRMYRDQTLNACAIEWDGVAIDAERREEARASLQAEIQQEREVALAGTPYQEIITKVSKKGEKAKAGVLNIASPKQMQEFIYKVRKYPIKLNKETKRPTTDADTLALFALKYNDTALQSILRMKEIQDEINDVIDQKLDPRGRIHCHVKLGGTNGTRWSTTKSILGNGTNLQNIRRVGVARSLFLPT
jgi:uracil-DNA glycosylase family 4